MSEWKPIDTASKNSRSRLVWCPDRKNIYVVCWDEGAWRYFGGVGILREEPTHWMPLPEPPEHAE